MEDIHELEYLRDGKTERTAGDQSRKKIYRLVHTSMGTEWLCVPSLVLVECVHAELLTYCQIQSTKLDFNRSVRLSLIEPIT